MDSIYQGILLFRRAVLKLILRGQDLALGHTIEYMFLALFLTILKLYLHFLHVY